MMMAIFGDRRRLPWLAAVFALLLAAGVVALAI